MQVSARLSDYVYLCSKQCKTLLARKGKRCLSSDYFQVQGPADILPRAKEILRETPEFDELRKVETVTGDNLASLILEHLQKDDLNPKWELYNGEWIFYFPLIVPCVDTQGLFEDVTFIIDGISNAPDIKQHCSIEWVSNGEEVTSEDYIFFDSSLRRPPDLD